MTAADSEAIESVRLSPLKILVTIFHWIYINLRNNLDDFQKGRFPPIGRKLSCLILLGHMSHVKELHKTTALCLGCMCFQYVL